MPSFVALCSLLEPRSPEAFLRDCLGKQVIEIAGRPNRWDSLISWKRINHLLAFSGITAPRIRLIKNGATISATAYQLEAPGSFPRLRLCEINRFLQQQVTLEIDAIDALIPALSDLCHALELDLSVPVQANLFLSCSGSACSASRNDFEMIILQGAGSRQWRIYGPTKAFPTKDTPPPPPEGRPKWEHAAAPGHLLYVPRGWWYETCTDGKPEFCIQILFRNPTALDILSRAVDQLNTSPFMRMDLPRFGDLDTQSAYLTALQTDISRAFSNAGIIRGFLKDMQAVAEPRAHSCLPWSAIGDLSDAPEESMLIPQVRFLTPDIVYEAQRTGTTEVFIGGQNVVIDREAGILLRGICARGRVGLGELLHRGTSAGESEADILV